LEGKIDYINYNPAAEIFLAQDGSADEMDLDDFTIQYGEISILADFGSVSEPKAQPAEMEGIIDDLAEDFKLSSRCQKNIRNMARIKLLALSA
jgi:hypothetical protein